METAEQSKFSILIVDDSEELLDVLSIVLKQQGHYVFIKAKPDTIIRFVKEIRIDLLLLDVVYGTYGEINGRNVCRKLKSDPLTNYFPIILMSVIYENLVDFKDCGADDVIEKPFDLHELIQKINSCLHEESAN